MFRTKRECLWRMKSIEMERKHSNRQMARSLVQAKLLDEKNSNKKGRNWVYLSGIYVRFTKQNSQLQSNGHQIFTPHPLAAQYELRHLRKMTWNTNFQQHAARAVKTAVAEPLYQPPPTPNLTEIEEIDLMDMICQ